MLAEIVAPNEHGILEEMSSAANWFDTDRKGNLRQVTPDLKYAKVYMSRQGRWGLPALSGVVSCPTLRADGSVLNKHGYDERSGIYCDLRAFGEIDIPEAPTQAEAHESLARLMHLLSTFPFVKPLDATVSLACVMTSVIRRTLDISPCFGFSAPARGTGKTKIVHIAAILSEGRRAVVSQYQTDEREMSVELGTMLMDGRAIMATDNVPEGVKIRGNLLAACITSPEVSCRILGHSKMPTLPSSALMTFGGCNISFSEDLVRRALISYLDAKTATPWKREFHNEPTDDAMAQRALLVRDVLTIIRAYIAAGSPKQLHPVGDFYAFCARIRDPLMWLGEPDVFLSQDALIEDDPDVQRAQAVMEHWHFHFKWDRVSCREVKDVAMSRRRDSYGNETREMAHKDFYDALTAVCPRSGIPDTHILGKWLETTQKRIVYLLIDGVETPVKFVRAGKANGAHRWRLAHRDEPDE